MHVWVDAHTGGCTHPEDLAPAPLLHSAHVCAILVSPFAIRSFGKLVVCYYNVIGYTFIALIQILADTRQNRQLALTF